jgi:hypothetical protein
VTAVWDRRAAAKPAADARPGVTPQLEQTLGPDEYTDELILPEQYHGSVYDVIPARTGYRKPLGEWNEEEIVASGRRIKVTLNGVIVLDADLDIVKEPKVLARHPGLARPAGHIGFLGHGSRVEFRNIRVKELP